MAITNVSSKEKTIKDMFSVLDSDNYTIDKSILYCNYEGNKIQFSNILDNYRDYFEQYLEEMDIPEKFYYQPAAFAENYYGTPDLDFLVLYFAKMKTLFEFNKARIPVLPKSRIIEINKLFSEYKEIVRESYNNPSKYVKEL